MVDKMFWTCLMNSHKLNGIILHLMFTTEMKLYKIFFKFFVTVKTISFILVTCHVCHVIKSKCSWHVKMMLSPPTQASIYLRKGNICPKLDTIKSWLLSFDCHDSDCIWASLITEQTEACAGCGGCAQFSTVTNYTLGSRVITITGAHFTALCLR